MPRTRRPSYRSSSILLLCALGLTTACTSTSQYKMSRAFPRPAASPVGVPVMLLPVQEIFEQRSSTQSAQSAQAAQATQAYRRSPLFLGSVLSEVFGYGPVPLIPLVIKFESYTSDIPRTQIVHEAAQARLAQHGIRTEAGSADGDGKPQGLAKGSLALSLRLRKYEVENKLSFLTLIICSGFRLKDAVPKAALDCRLWRGGDDKPLYDGIVEATCDDACFSQRRSKERFTGETDMRNQHGETVAAAVDDCLEKSGLVRLHSGAVARGFAELMEQGLFVEAYRMASSPEQMLEAVKGLSRSASGRTVPEEARDLMARGKATVAMAKSPADFSSAVSAMEKSLILAPWWASGHYNTALASEGAGQWAAGTRHLKAYLALKPDADDREAVRMKIAEFELHQERGDAPGQAP